MFKLILAGALTYKTTKLINEYSDIKDFECAAKKYQKALEEWKEKKDKLLLEKPEELDEEAQKEWEEKKDKLMLEKKELEKAQKELEKAQKEWEEKRDKLVMERPKTPKEFEEEVKNLIEPKITNYYNPNFDYFRIYIGAVCGAIVGLTFLNF